jgi:phenolic acid decarboxylase
MEIIIFYPMYDTRRGVLSGRVKYTNVIVWGLSRGDYTTSQKEPTNKQVTLQIITETQQ